MLGSKFLYIKSSYIVCMDYVCYVFINYPSQEYKSLGDMFTT